jgi:RNA polymerase sigma-70 factor (ECF subfamily)
MSELEPTAMGPLQSNSRTADAVSLDREEADLLRQIVGKDMAAFEQFYRSYYRRLSRFLDQVTRKPHLNDEILNDTMMVVWRKAPAFNGRSRVSTWVFAIAYKKAMKALRREPRLQDALSETHADADATTWAVGPETELIDRESRLSIRHLLSALSAEQRAVIELTYYHGYAYKDIAAVVGCPIATVKTRMFHARRRLREMLIAQGQEPSENALLPLR